MLFSLTLDHLVVAARTLEEGAAYVEAVLGVRLASGGQHVHMGTHNLLLSLGPEEYLEVIAIDPEAAPPDRPRWFGLDDFQGAPRMTNWVCRTNDLDEATAAAPRGTGEILEFTRDDLTWAMAVPPDGGLPFDAAMPALIEWEADSPHPARRLPEADLRLVRLDVFHPDADALRAAFPALNAVDRVAVRTGPEKRLIATISTPEGNRVLA